MAQESTRQVTITRVFNAPVAPVWQAWSDEERVREWWGPTGFTSPLAKMDFREGGISLVCMRAPQEMGGQDMYNTRTYRKIVPHERIEFILHFSDRNGTRLDPSAMDYRREFRRRFVMLLLSRHFPRIERR